MHPSPDVLALLALGEKAGTPEERPRRVLPQCRTEIAELARVAAGRSATVRRRRWSRPPSEGDAIRRAGLAWPDEPGLGAQGRPSSPVLPTARRRGDAAPPGDRRGPPEGQVTSREHGRGDRIAHARPRSLPGATGHRRWRSPRAALVSASAWASLAPFVQPRQTTVDGAVAGPARVARSIGRGVVERDGTGTGSSR